MTPIYNVELRKAGKIREEIFWCRSLLASDSEDGRGADVLIACEQAPTMDLAKSYEKAGDFPG
jgi:hypothetical protein